MYVVNTVVSEIVARREVIYISRNARGPNTIQFITNFLPPPPLTDFLTFTVNAFIPTQTRVCFSCNCKRSDDEQQSRENDK